MCNVGVVSVHYISLLLLSFFKHFHTLSLTLYLFLSVAVGTLKMTLLVRVIN